MPKWMSNVALARDYMVEEFVALPADTPVALALDRLTTDAKLFAVVEEPDGTAQTAVTPAHLKTVRDELGDHASSATLLEKHDALPPILFVADDVPLADIVEWPRLQELSDPDWALICLRDGKAVGVLSREAVVRYIAEEYEPSSTRGTM